MLNFTKIKVFNTKGFFLILVFLMITVISTSVYAQCPPIDPFCEDPDLPLDDGVIFLFIAGALFGIKKIRDNQRGLKNLQPAE